MADFDFQSILSDIKNSVTALALSTVKEYANEAKADALQFVENSKANLQTWIVELSQGQLTQADFEDLVMGLKDLMQMNALQQAGFSLIEADQFKISLLNTVIKTVVSLI